MIVISRLMDYLIIHDILDTWIIYIVRYIFIHGYTKSNGLILMVYLGNGLILMDYLDKYIKVYLRERRIAIRYFTLL